MLPQEPLTRKQRRTTGNYDQHEEKKLDEKVEQIFAQIKLKKNMFAKNQQEQKKYDYGKYNDSNQNYDHQEEQCILCERNRPVFLVDSDDMILRMQERFLPPFLKNLKQDYLANKLYLKYLKISSKFIYVCDCDWKRCHAYCATAFVLRSQKIYCKDCYTYFFLYVKSQRLFTGELLGDMTKYLVFFIALIGFIYGVYTIDNFLKEMDAQNNYESQMSRKDLTSIQKTELQNQYEKGLQTQRVENQFVMVPLIIVLTVIIIWFFYLRFVISFLKRKKLVWVEVQDFKDPECPVSRNDAKKNLHLVCEMTQKLKSYSYLFDKYWYRQREFQYIDGITQEQLAQFRNEQQQEEAAANQAAEPAAEVGSEENRKSKADIDVKPHIKKYNDMVHKQKLQAKKEKLFGDCDCNCEDNKVFENQK